VGLRRPEALKKRGKNFGLTRWRPKRGGFDVRIRERKEEGVYSRITGDERLLRGHSELLLVTEPFTWKGDAFLGVDKHRRIGISKRKTGDAMRTLPSL